MIAVEVKKISKQYRIWPQKKYLTIRERLINIFNVGFDAHNYFEALKDLSFSVKKGEICGVIGLNGSGKSTLLKLISKITIPTGGCIKVSGKIASILEVGTGFHPELSGRENIYLNGIIHGMKKEQVDRRMEEIIDFSEIKNFIDMPVKRYSSGMYVRLAFAVAAHLNADIILVDEVLAVGDYQFKKKCIKKIKDLAKNQGKTIIFVSHNLSIVSDICDKVILLNNGKIEFIAEPELAIKEYYQIAKLNGPINLPLSDRKDRLGNGKVLFNDIFLKNLKGAKIFFSGYKMTIFVDYINKAHAQINNLDFIAILYNFKDVPVLKFDNSLIGKNIRPKKKGRIIIKTENIFLNPGNYYLNIALRDENQIYDLVEKAICFTVVNDKKDNNSFLKFSERSGIVPDIIIPYSLEHYERKFL